MKIISTLLICSALAITMHVSAQNGVSLEIGVNQANRYLNARTMKPFSNYMFGISWDRPINDALYLRVGAGFAEDSKKLLEKEGDYVAAHKSYTISNFDIPVTVGYKKEMDKFSLFGEAGLFWSKHLNGNMNVVVDNCNKNTIYTTERNENIWFGKDVNDWRKFDLGFLVKAGVEYKNFELAGSFAMGLLDQTNASGVVYRSMSVWKDTKTMTTFDYGITPEAVKRLTVTLSYRFDVSEGKAKVE